MMTRANCALTHVEYWWSSYRSNLAALVLQLKALGIDNVAKFDFMTSPPAQLMIRALEVRALAEPNLLAGYCMN